jgi:cytochrome P450
MATAALPPGPRRPGPLQAVSWGLRYPQFTSAAHRRFGPTFTVRPGTMPPLVLTSDRDAVRRLFTGDPLAKRAGNDAVRPLVTGRSLMLLGPAEHLERRKLLLPPFHGDRVRAYAQLMQRLVDDELGRWRPGDTVAVLPIAQNLTIEVILQAVLGVADADMRRRFRRHVDDLLFYPLGSLRLRAGRRFVGRSAPPQAVREVAALLSSLPSPAVSTYFPELKTRSWRNPATLRWWTHHDRLLALIDEQIASTRRDPRLDEREDILAMLVQARDEDGEPLPAEALREDVLLLIAAGHETTAAAIAWGAVLLAHHDDVRARAADAARDGDERYVAALVKEVLRLRPPIPVAAGRVLDEPFAIGDDVVVPPGTLVLVDAWGIHHDPELYPDPARFAPERFLDGAPERYTWLPFGGGAHRCLGAALAELEVQVALTAMLRAVELAPADPEVAPVARRGITMVPHGGARVRVAATLG